MRISGLDPKVAHRGRIVVLPSHRVVPRACGQAGAVADQVVELVCRISAGAGRSKRGTREKRERLAHRYSGASCRSYRLVPVSSAPRNWLDLSTRTPSIHLRLTSARSASPLRPWDVGTSRRLICQRPDAGPTEELRTRGHVSHGSVASLLVLRHGQSDRLRILFYNRVDGIGGIGRKERDREELSGSR